MPNFNRRGPRWGGGPGAGWGRGPCGYGRDSEGYGRGYGFQRSFPTKKEESEMLNDETEALKKELEAIKERLAEIEN